MIKGRISQFQQPRAKRLGVFRLVVQVHFQPENRVRIARIERGLIVCFEQIIARDDIRLSRLPPHVLKHLHHLAQGQALSGFVENNCASQHR